MLLLRSPSRPVAGLRAAWSSPVREDFRTKDQGLGDAAGKDLEPALGDESVDDLAGDLLVCFGQFGEVGELSPELAEVVAYLAQSRPRLVIDDAVTAVFLATNGERLGATWLTSQVHRYVEASGVGKSGSCHLFRHSAATLMLEGGADVRYVQELLGHRELSSTHIYTRVAPSRLAAVHAACHPGAALPSSGLPSAGIARPELPL